jgi:hypothetical protein
MRIVSGRQTKGARLACDVIVMRRIYRRNRFRLQKNLMSSEPTVLHVLIELLNFRLLRFFKYVSLPPPILFVVQS